MWDKITYPFPNSIGYAVEVWEWISYFNSLYWAWDYIGMLELKLYHVSKMGPRIVANKVWDLTRLILRYLKKTKTLLKHNYTRAGWPLKCPYPHVA